jgi:sugar/nucleoside kinase (ribokinase family)
MFVVVGSTTVDVLVSGMHHMPILGGDEFSLDNLAFCDRPLQMTVGGNGANTAYVLGRLGFPVTLCSAIGQDALGDLMGGWLQDAGVDTSLLKRSADAATSTTTVVMDEARNRISFHHAGANATLSYMDLPVNWLENARVLLITSYPLLSGLRVDGYATLLAQARQRGTVTALDIGPAIGTPACLEEVRDLLPLVDILIANQHELAVCCATEEVDAGMERLAAAGAATIVIKCGPWGARVRQGNDSFTVAAVPVEVRSTVGAGDAFNAGILAGVQQGLSLDEAVRLGNAAAALVISSARGILDGPTWDRVQRFRQGHTSA